MKKSNQRMNRRRGDGYNALRVYHRAAVGKKSPRLLIKCGDCGNKLEISYDPERADLEIGGVLGSIENWRELLLPLLKRPRSPYGATARQLTRFARRMDRQIAAARKAGTITRYSGDLEADIAN